MRNTLVESGLKRQNVLFKGGTIKSKKDKQKHDRNFRKRQFKKEINGIKY